MEPHCDHCEIWNAERSAECRSQAFPPFSFLLELKRSNRACPRQTESILAVACAWFRQWKKITPPSENLQPTQHPSRTKTVGPMEKEKMRHRPTPQLHMYVCTPAATGMTRRTLTHDNLNCRQPGYRRESHKHFSRASRDSAIKAAKQQTTTWKRRLCWPCIPFSTTEFA